MHNTSSPSEKPKYHWQEHPLLSGLASDIELFRSPIGAGYARIVCDGHKETWPLRSEGFRRWLLRELFESDSGPTEQERIQKFLEAIAQIEHQQHEVFTRVGGSDRRFFLDLARSSSVEAVDIPVNPGRSGQ